MFQHLLANAIQFIDKPEGYVDIRYTDNETSWTFRIADNGIGIAPKYHEKIFKIFQKLSTDTEGENIGIGLSLVRRIVDIHQGEVWLTSTPGQGSTFHVSLPKI